jgi:hypothetical protein
MKIFQRAVLHPSLGNEYRDDVIQWCKDNISDTHNEDWYVSSNYDSHGCYNVEIFGEQNEKFVSAFLMQFSDTLLLSTDYRYELETATESLALFEGLES